MRKERMLSMLFGVVLALGFTVVSVSSQPSGSGIREVRVNQEELRIAQEVLANNEAKLMRLPGVVGVGIGTTEQGKQAAIHVFVNAEAAGGTKPSAIPTQIDKVPIRIIETNEIKAR